MIKKSVSFIYLFTQQSLKKRTNSEVHLKPYQISMMDLFLQKWLTANPYRSVISIKLLCNVIEITLRHGLAVNYFCEKTPS